MESKKSFLLVVCVLLSHGLYAQQAMRKKDTSMTIAQQERRRAEVMMDSTNVIVCPKSEGKGTVKQNVFSSFLASDKRKCHSCGWVYRDNMPYHLHVTCEECKGKGFLKRHAL